METKEINFEDLVVEYLTTKGGYMLGDESAYNPEKGYAPTKLMQFIKNSQEKKWSMLQKIHGDETEAYFLKYVESNIREHGLLSVLRSKTKLNGIDFKLVYFKPETDLSEESITQYNQNILEVVRQLHYSANNNNSLDVVLFLDGFPIVTMELKNQYTGQTTENAVKQYKENRDPKEPIFLFNERSLVHFAVDLFDCKMTTKLNGGRTFFLPFNQGSNGAGNVGGYGNPNNDDGFGTSYLWEEILSKEILMEILARYMHLEYDEKSSFKTGKMIFPRYHQLDVVTKIIRDVKERGSGKNYLVQHSAGSGKSNSIAWLSYRLSSLHDKENNKMFDSVIVVTDRRVLNNQLQETIYQFDHVPGVVEKITKNSEQLLSAINNDKKIIITTLQKFPVIYKEINSTNKSFAVIIDEAHSSQTGQSATKLKSGLGNIEEVLEEYAQIEGEAEEEKLDYQDQILKEISAHGFHSNMSFFAFTATPKDKTLQMFGDKQNDGSFQAFHIYSMQQAIEEGFILDVLENYMTYDTFYKIIKKSKEDPKLPSSKGLKQILQFQSLHPHNLSQKVHIMVEHFMETTIKKMDGKAKAMLVTPSRLHAVRYYQEFKKYLKENNINDIKVLVAFSGEVRDGGQVFTEQSMNIDFNGERIKENQLPKRFEKDYNLLIVAEKYQTGFDEPLLHTMFVDKPLSGVKAVQTLSRLNRTSYGKRDTFILDFVNNAEDIQTSFQPYYQKTVLSKGFDPNNVYNVYKRVEAYKIFTREEVTEFTKTYYDKEEDMSKLNYYLFNPKKKYQELDKEDQTQFKSILQAFLRTYSFVAQVSRMMDIEMQENFIFCKYFNKVLPKDVEKIERIIDKIDLEYYRIEKRFEGSIELTKDIESLDPAKGDIGKKTPEEEEALSDIIEKINKKYNVNDKQAYKVVEQIAHDFLSDDEMIDYAKNNKQSDFKKVYNDEFKRKTYRRYKENEKMFEKMMSEEGYLEDIMAAMLPFVYEKLKER